MTPSVGLTSPRCRCPAGAWVSGQGGPGPVPRTTRSSPQGCPLCRRPGGPRGGRRVQVGGWGEKAKVCSFLWSCLLCRRPGGPRGGEEGAGGGREKVKVCSFLWSCLLCRPPGGERGWEEAVGKGGTRGGEVGGLTKNCSPLMKTTDSLRMESSVVLH